MKRTTELIGKILPKAALTIAACCTAWLASCSNDEEMPATEEPKEYTVMLACAKDTLEVTHSPLSRTEETERPYLLGIQVYSSHVTEDNYRPYAFGLFDDIELAAIKLYDRYKYAFEVTIVWNGQNLLYCNKDYNNHYLWPFNTFLTNGFTYSTSERLDGLSLGRTTIPAEDGSWEEQSMGINIDRDYGRLEGYIPEKNGAVTIETKYMTSAFRYIVNGLTEGELAISLNNGIFTWVYPDRNDVWDAFNYENFEYAYLHDYDNYWIDLTWIRGEDYTSLGSYEVRFNRGFVNTVTINMGAAATSANDAGDASESRSAGNDGGTVINIPL